MLTNPRQPLRRMDSRIPRSDKTSDERQLMVRVSEGDEKSLMVIYDRYSSLAYGIAFHVLRDASAAEDIMQEVFLRLWRDPKAFDANRGSLSAWITINARHRAVDYWRKHRRESQLPEDSQSEEAAISHPEYMPDMEKVRAILRALPAAQRDLLELSYFAGLSHSEIVTRSGLPLGTVKSRIRRALQSIRETLMPEGVKQKKTTGNRNPILAAERSLVM